MAPSASDSVVVGHDEVAGPASSRLPRPTQSGHAPYGLLNEKSRGASSSIETPCTGHASACENDSSSPSTIATTTVPLGEPQRRLDAVGEPRPDARPS